ncbi:MAG: tandem-95 repeat protein, partial [Alphaproteobacteria bacterium]|nr:tandem-95 repeat protein [Alphaproteobacteria bacterium]
MVRRVGSSGQDVLRGSLLDDIILGLSNDDILFGLAGNDRLFGGDGTDRMFGADGNDLFRGGAGNDVAVGGAGNDRIFGDDGNDTLRGGDGNDVVRGGVGDDRIFGDAGDDNLAGGTGDDFIRGGEGNDRLLGQAGADRLIGDAGDDTLLGGSGADRLEGGTGSDRLLGGTDNDTLFGGDDNDTLSGQSGDDTLSGGAGIDSAQFSGPIADYDIVQVGPDLQVTHARGTMLDGTDLVLADVERLVFQDVTLDLTSNSPPTAADDTATTDEDTGLVVATSVLDNDFDLEASVNLQTLVVSEVNGNPADVGNQITLTSGALLTVNADGTYEYDPNGVFDFLPAGSSDTDTFVYTVSDGSGGTSTATVTVTVTGVNDGPAVANATINAPGTENGPVAAVDLLQDVTDAEGDALAVDALAQTAGRTGVHSLVGNTIVVDTSAFDDLALGQTETLTFTYNVIDGNGGILARTLNLEITGTNDAPLAGAVINAAASEDGPATAFDLLTGATDVDLPADTLTATNLQPVSGPALAVPASIVANQLVIDMTQSTFQGLAAGETVDLAFTFDVSDGLLTDGSAIIVTVTGTNDAPTVNAALADTTATEDAPFVFTVDPSTFDDVDGDALTLTAQLSGGGALPAWLTFDAVNGVFSGTPANGDVGTLSIDVTASDGTASVTDTFDVVISGVNDAPVADLDAATVAQDAALVLNVLANDSDEEDTGGVLGMTGTVTTFTIGASTANAGDTITLANGAVVSIEANGDVTLTQNDAFDGLDDGDSETIAFAYTVSDTGGLTATSAGAITVTGTNDGPVVTTPELVSGAEDTVLSGLIDASDVDGDTLTYVLGGTAATNGTAVVNADGTYTYTPNADFNGSDTFTVDVSDGLVTETVTVNVTVNAVNDAPVAVDDTAAVSEGDAVFSGSVATNDSDIETAAANLIYALVAAAPAGLTFNADGTFAFAPADAAYDGLAVGETLDVVAAYTVTDDDATTPLSA